MSTSLKEAIEAAKAKVAAAYDVAESKGAKISTEKNLSYLAEAINSIVAPSKTFVEFIDESGISAIMRNNIKIKTVKIEKTELLTTLYSVFYNCSSLETFISPTTFPNVINANQAFALCGMLHADMVFNLPIATDLGAMFERSGITSMNIVAESATTIVNIGRYNSYLQSAYIKCGSDSVIADFAFRQCYGLKTITIDASIKGNFNYFADSCVEAEYIELKDLSAVSNITMAFNGCRKCTDFFVDVLPDISLTGAGFNTMPLNHDSLIRILNALPTSTNGFTCSLGSTNLAKLSNEEKAIATAKGWTLA